MVVYGRDPGSGNGGTHALVVFGLGKNLLFKSVLGHCGKLKGISRNHCSCFIFKKWVWKFNKHGPLTKKYVSLNCELICEQ